MLPITSAWVDEQQQAADLWLRLGFLPAKVDVRAGLLSPEAYAALGLCPLDVSGR